MDIQTLTIFFMWCTIINGTLLVLRIIMNSLAGFGVLYAKQMVSHSPRNLQRSLLLVPWVIQNCFSVLHCCPLRGFVDRWITIVHLTKPCHLAAFHSRK